jgi:dihydroxyacetone kinase DhaKLM complex PTS-EIIA-like component DhaM
MKSKWETRGGKRLLYCDFSNFGTDTNALSAEIDAADEAILREPKESVLLLVDLRGTVTSSAVVDLFKKSSAKTKGYLRRQAIVGLSGIQKMLAQAVAWFSRETFVLFDTDEAAREWLIDDGSEAGVVVKGA